MPTEQVRGLKARGSSSAMTIWGAMADFFPGFEARRIATAGTRINLVTGGSGPPLLLHGYPQTHVMWRKVAPGLLRGREAASRSTHFLSCSARASRLPERGQLARR